MLNLEAHAEAILRAVVSTCHASEDEIAAFCKGAMADAGPAILTAVRALVEDAMRVMQEAAVGAAQSAWACEVEPEDAIRAIDPAALIKDKV